MLSNCVWVRGFFLTTVLHSELDVVVNSPPTVASRRGDAATAVGKSVFAQEELGNGPRVTGFDLADHPDQHILLCRQDLVVAGRRLCRGRMDRSSVHPYLH